MNRGIWTAILALAISASAQAASKLDSEAANQLSADLRRDHANLEKLMKEARKKPEPRAVVEKKFRESQVRDKIAFENSLTGLSVGEKNAAHNEYAARRLAGEKAHAQKLKSLKPIGSELNDKRKNVDQKSKDRLMEVYS